MVHGAELHVGDDEIAPVRTVDHRVAHVKARWHALDTLHGQRHYLRERRPQPREKNGSSSVTSL